MAHTCERRWGQTAHHQLQHRLLLPPPPPPTHCAAGSTCAHDRHCHQHPQHQHLLPLEFLAYQAYVLLLVLLLNHPVPWQRGPLLVLLLVHPAPWQRGPLLQQWRLQLQSLRLLRWSGGAWSAALRPQMPAGSSKFGQNMP
jgi:hypothetical protein